MRIEPRETLRMAVDSVWSHKMRSGLTILGIVIGITTVVVVASLMSGLNQQMVDMFKQFGPNSVWINRVSGPPTGPGMSPKERRRPQFRAEYGDELLRATHSIDDLGSVDYIIPQGRVITAKVPGYESDSVTLIGQTPNIMSKISPRDLSQGRMFTDEENVRRMRVAVIGWELANALFPNHDSIGKPVIIDGEEYTIVGVFDKAKGSFFGENQQDYEAIIPFLTARAHYPESRNIMFEAEARPGMRDDAVAEVTDVMRKIRHIPRGKDDDFNVTTPDAIIANFNKISGMILMISIAISGVGLLVGGVGVMNIMLVSVTERTREIGVRKAIGARRTDIIAQFLSEAVALTGTGGIIGIVFAIGLTLLIGFLAPSLPSVVPAWAVITGFSVSVGVGVFFGVWPAVMASKLDPVEALRYE